MNMRWWAWALVAFGLVVGWFVAMGVPDAIRYMKMRRM